MNKEGAQGQCAYVSTTAAGRCSMLQLLSYQRPGCLVGEARSQLIYLSQLLVVIVTRKMPHLNSWPSCNSCGPCSSM
jgi:hypothetical protein